jgi:hypothetical protein
VAAYFSRRLGLRLPAGPSYPYLRLPIRVASPAQKRRLFALSQAYGLGLSVGYPQPLDEVPELRGVFNGEQYPAARRVAGTLLTLPTHHWLSTTDKRAIVACVRNGLTKRHGDAVVSVAPFLSVNPLRPSASGATDRDQEGDQ